jgi:hypothetical protein
MSKGYMHHLEACSVIPCVGVYPTGKHAVPGAARFLHGGIGGTGIRRQRRKTLCAAASIRRAAQTGLRPRA